MMKVDQRALQESHADGSLMSEVGEGIQALRRSQLACPESRSMCSLYRHRTIGLQSRVAGSLSQLSQSIVRMKTKW